MYKSLILVSVAVAAFAGLVLAEEPEYAVNLITTANQEIKFPYWRDLRAIPDDMRVAVNKNFINMLSYMNTTLGEILTSKNVGIGLPKALYIAGVMTQKGYQLMNDMKKFGDSTALVADHQDDLTVFNKAVAAGSKALAKTLKSQGIKVEPKQFELEKTASLEALIEALEVSPVSMYFDWSRGTIRDLNQPDSEPRLYQDALIETYGRARHLGFGKVLDSFDGVVALYEKFVKG